MRLLSRATPAVLLFAAIAGCSLPLPMLAVRETLFDGRELEAWRSPGGGPALWTRTDDGVVRAVAGAGRLVSVGQWADHRVHVEFRIPLAEAGGAVGGVFVHGRYQILIVDSFAQKPGPETCGALVGLKAPSRDMCRKPGEWQTLDVEFLAPRFDEHGNVYENARITVIQNTSTIHDDVELPGVTPGALDDFQVAKGPLMLRDRTGLVEFRNVWVKSL
ncbi:MAG TPA: DUF1080 domain-containing protein [Planctomycetota bacterium]